MIRPLPLARACFSAILLLTDSLFLAGCGGQSGSRSTVSGKVTLNGQPVAGEVTFTVGDQTTTATINSDGTYTIINPAKGMAKVTVKGLTNPGKTAPGTKMPDMGQGGGGVAPPKKYEKADNGLTFEVTGGDQKFDIALNP